MSDLQPGEFAQTSDTPYTTCGDWVDIAFHDETVEILEAKDSDGDYFVKHPRTGTTQWIGWEHLTKITPAEAWQERAEWAEHQVKQLWTRLERLETRFADSQREARAGERTGEVAHMLGAYIDARRSPAGGVWPVRRNRS